MPVNETDSDKLELDLSVTNAEESQSKIDNFVAASRKAADTLNTVFKTSSDFSSDQSKKILSLQKEVTTLTSKFVQLTKSSAAGSNQKFIADTAEKQIVDLTNKLSRLQEIDSQFAAGFGRGTARLQSKLKDEINQIANDIEVAARKYLQAKQIVAIADLQPQLAEPRRVSPFYIDSRFEALQSRASTLDAQFAGLRDASLKDKRLAGIGQEADAARVKIKALTTQIYDLEKLANSNTDDQSLLRKMLTDTKLLQAELRNARRHYFELRSAARDVPRGPAGGGFGGGGGGGSTLRNAASYGGKALNAFGVLGFAGGLGPAAGIGAAILGLERFIHFSDIALQKASEQVRSNRLLASSATEAGIAYSDLAAKNSKFAETLGVNTVRASQISARIAQLSARTARPENIDKLFKAFGDLSAARGLDPNELQTVVQQVITGQDEGYKKLGLQNPSILYKNFADKSGRSSDSLSSLEKARIFEDEVIKKANLFAGAADARLKSLDGRVSKLYANIENLKFGLSSAFANNLTVIQGIDEISRAVKNLTGDFEKLYDISKQRPVTDKEISDVARPYAITNFAKGFGSLVLSGAGSLTTNLGLNRGDYDSSYRKYFAETAAGVVYGTDQSNREDLVRQSLNAQKLEEAQQKRIAADQKAELARQDAEDKRRAEEQRLEQQYREKLADPRRTITELREIRDRLGNNSGLFNQDEALSTSSQRALRLDAEKAISQDTANQFSTILQKPKVALQELRKAIQDIQVNGEIFPDEKTKLLQNFEQAIDGIKNKVNSLKNSFVDLLSGINPDNNPFTAILNDASKITQESEKFRGLGADAVNFVKQQREVEISRRLTEQRYRSADDSLRLRQEARRIEATPETQTGDFTQRLTDVEKRVEFSASNFALTRQYQEDEFFASKFNPYNPKSFLEDRLGLRGIEKLTEDFSAPGRGRGENIRDYQDRVFKAREEYLQTSLAVADSFEKLRNLDSINLLGTGLYGEEAKAKEILSFLPNREALLPRLYSFGKTKEESQGLLTRRAQAQRVLKEANEKKFTDFLETQKFIELSKTDLDERGDLLKKSGLQDFRQIEEYLNISGELGSNNLNAQQRQLRIQALNAKATFKDSQEKDAQDRNTRFDTLIKSMQTQIDGAGLKVDIGEDTILDVTLNVPVGTGVSTQNNRPTSSNVGVKYG